MRKKLPGFAAAFTRLDPGQRAQVISDRPGPYFTRFLAELLGPESAYSYRMAESLTRFAVLPCAPYLGLPELGPLLQAWTDNGQSLMASEMPQNAVVLYQSTAHLRPLDAPLWRNFVERVRNVVPVDEPYYRYTQLAAALGM
ncbi:hypothetical protein [Streptomyces chartreusis]